MSAQDDGCRPPHKESKQLLLDSEASFAESDAAHIKVDNDEPLGASTPQNKLGVYFKEQGTRLVITLVLIVGLIGIVKGFQDAGNIPHRKKSAFNVIITILSLALGLNFLEAFKDMAKVYRWRILAGSKFTVRETDLILGGESLTKLIQLMMESWKKPVTIAVCVSWIVLNLLAQASIAMVGLTYSMDGGSDSNGTTTNHGLVNAPKLDCYYDSPISPCNQAPEVPQILAHSYGEIIKGWQICGYNDLNDIINSEDQNCYYFGKNDDSEYAFRFLEYNLNDASRAYPYLTSRIITASSHSCYYYNATAAGDISGPDGTDGITVWQYSNTTFDSTINTPKPSAALDASTYIYYGVEQPQLENATACGPRCLNMYMMRHHGTPGLGGSRPMTLVQCPVTVNPVTNATSPNHALSDANARLAVGAIALQGHYNNAVYNVSFNTTGPTQSRQYQLYPWGAAWETSNLDADEVGSRMAHLNPVRQIQGTVPTLAWSLSIEWPYFIALVACIAGVHALLFGLMLWFSRGTVVMGYSNLMVARLLQPLVGGLGSEESLLGGKNIAKAIQRRGVKQ